MKHLDARWFVERLPPPARLEEILGNDPAAALLSIARTRAPVEMGVIPPSGPIDPVVAEQLALAAEAAAKLKQARLPNLSEKEIQALHALVHLVARPALRVRDGDVPDVPESWAKLGTSVMVKRRIRGVGRLDTHDRRPTGTGWFVAPGIVMTNNHVVAQLCGINVLHDPEWRKKLESARVPQNKIWLEKSALRPTWDPGDAPHVAQAPAGRVSRIRATHPAFDMALLDVEGVADSGALALPLSKSGPNETSRHDVYLAGYPAVLDGYGMHPALVTFLFGGTDTNVLKRVSPGQLLDVQSIATHDASTLGGSSGSPVIDFDNHRVVALHFAGQYGEENRSVPLWLNAGTPFFKDNDLEFS